MSEGNMDVFDYDYDEESGKVRVNLVGSIYGASIEDYPEVMSRVINILQEVPETQNVVLSESRDYEYDEKEVEMLKEVAENIKQVSNEKVLSKRGGECSDTFSKHLPDIQKTIIDRMPKDPVGAFVELKRKKRHVKTHDESPESSSCLLKFEEDVMQPLLEFFGSMEIIEEARQRGFVTGHHVGERDVYREIFHPLVRPNFMLTKYMSLPPERGEQKERYTVGDNIDVEIYEVPEKVQYIYHVNPPEFSLPEEKYNILDAARRYMGSHDPESGEFARPERMRDIFENIGKDMIRDISQQMDIDLGQTEVEELASILNRYTSGLGVLELLLSDPKVQDVYVNSPVGQSPIYIKHQDYEECETNLIPTKDDAESWATRFRIKSGRPLDEANPVLDTDAKVPGGRARVAIIQEDLSPDGLAFAFRRHRSRIWTLPLFINNDMINPLGAGVLSFLVYGNRSVIFSGTRGSGKTSLLSASLLEILKKHRIVTVEDTLELPVSQMKDLGFNIERMKSRSVITEVESEIGADEAIRTSLRLGDSALVVGEVRSDEAKSLYEAMRVGAVANFVGGTIHGENAYAVFDRVVNDLGVPKTSFKATDIIVSVNKIRSPDGLESYRRVTGITEVRKDWSDDPMSENAFVELMRYDSNEDELVPTDELKNGESLIMNRIAENIKDWKNNWQAVWDNIQMRKETKKELVEKANETGNKEIMEADFVVKSNQMFQKISKDVRENQGEQSKDVIMRKWRNWLDNEV